MNGVYENINDYNSRKRLKVLVFDNMIADISTKKNSQLTTELLFGKVFQLFLSCSQNFLIQECVKLDSTGYFILKIPNKCEL